MKKMFIGLSLIGLFVGCAQDNVMELEGRVAVKGSEPHTYLSIKDTKTQTSYKIHNQAKFDLTKKQNKMVKVKAVVVKEAIGPGFPAVIEVVEVQ
ncbi:hypothetical protein TSL6_04100 [Sulfurovum sp. TSL6]|uniref:hypothetical protein n=1 Tax=Sulfurovum sp. TSL6 TaxID=2826995 RepID=UPI001CC40E4E|nr:hypothetical protein [Sulfurovum sp. TSL6]GIT99903.1 hypothetical protein TSL6_04100 [Sulfurovum sp. TSL6]